MQVMVPKDISSSEIGYIMNRFASDSDLLSLFIDWGNRGFLLIHDHGESFELEKLREMNDLNAKSYERELLDSSSKTAASSIRMSFEKRASRFRWSVPNTCWSVPSTRKTAVRSIRILRSFCSR